jgi:hypothetical protein
MDNEVITKKEGAKEEATFFDLSPISRWRRIALGLTDFFLFFILSLGVFSFVAFPIMHTITGYGTMLTNEITWNLNAVSSLYDNGVLYVDNESNKGYLTASLEDTCLHFTSSCVDPESYDKDKTNPFYHYYITLHSNDSLVSYYKEADKFSTYFGDELETNGIPKLKDTYKKEFAPYFSSDDTPSSQAQSDYSSFSEGFFLVLYHNMLERVSTVDFKEESSLGQYQVYINKIQSSTNLRYQYVSYCALSSYLFSYALYYILTVLLSKRGKTIGMMILKESRVSIDSFHLVPRKIRLSIYLWSLFLDLPFLFFLPATVISFENLFAIPSLFIFAILGLVLDLVSLGLVIFTSYSQAFADIVSHTIIVKDNDLETVYTIRKEELL